MQSRVFIAVMALCPLAASADIMPPAPLPEYKAGETYVYVSAGKQTRTVVDSVSGDLVNFRDPDSNTTWSYFRNFALPTPYWNSNSPQTSGQRFVGDIDSFFPLRVGNVMEFLVEGEDRSSGNEWSYTTRCEVTGNGPVTVPAGAFETYKVDCVSSQWGWEKTFYYAPREQVLVREESRADGSPETVQELVSYNK